MWQWFNINQWLSVEFSHENRHWLRWVGRVLCMLTGRLSCCTLFFEAGNGWKIAQGDRLMKTLISGLTGVGVIVLRSWNPRDSRPQKGLEMTGDVP